MQLQAPCVKMLTDPHPHVWDRHRASRRAGGSPRPRARKAAEARRLKLRRVRREKYQVDAFGYDEVGIRCGLLANAELEHRVQKRLTTRRLNACFRREVCIEDLHYQRPRGCAVVRSRRGSGSSC